MIAHCTTVLDRGPESARTNSKGEPLTINVYWGSFTITVAITHTVYCTGQDSCTKVEVFRSANLVASCKLAPTSLFYHFADITKIWVLTRVGIIMSQILAHDRELSRSANHCHQYYVCVQTDPCFYGTGNENFLILSQNFGVRRKREGDHQAEFATYSSY